MTATDFDHFDTFARSCVILAASGYIFYQALSGFERVSNKEIGLVPSNDPISPIAKTYFRFQLFNRDFGNRK